MPETIDMHTQAFGAPWMARLKAHGAPNYGTKHMPDGRDYLLERARPR
jgi:hypothetical protein